MVEGGSMAKGKGTAGAGDKQKDVRMANIISAKQVADAVRTSLGPRGMDKMIVKEKGEVIITNDGATILNKLEVNHPCAKMLVELSKAQDVEAGDGTTSVVVLCGSMLKAAQTLLGKEIHPSDVAASFLKCGKLAHEILQDMSTKIDIHDRETLIKAAITSLSSKVVSQNSALLAPMAVDSVYKVRNKTNDNVDLKNIRVVTSVGGTVDDTELVTNGTIFKQRASGSAGGPTKITNAKIALIQFQLSPPKTDMEMQVAIKDYQQIDRVIKQERQYILNLCKKIKEAGCNVLLIQKSVLRDAVNDQSLDFLAKMKIMVLKDIERTDVDFITKTLGCLPITHIDHFKAEKFGYADLVQQEATPEGKIVRVTGVKQATDPMRMSLMSQPTATCLIRGSNNLLAAEAERSFHDALCVVRSLVKTKAIVPGGGACEIELSLNIQKKARELTGIDSYCAKQYAEAFETVPYTLAENAGLNPIRTVTELRNKHVEENKSHGINVRKGCVSDMDAENVVVPLLVPLSAVKLATETVAMILKIDDIVHTR
eukprot:TRINITY_DN7694_c0_g1_i1.p1 TRINITY_DN7694_c0_g1~~TRINITY_DN7694_c0_g1_i1.p1  ORF type:complete len:541 (+),score=280.06 TRINITY_DN7694_c0_g1_i1:50-1672(+)